MAVPYHDLLAACALRTNALIGAKAGPLETTYNTRPLTAANFNSSIFPFSDYRTAILSAIQKLAQVIAKSDDEDQRAYLMAQTAARVNGASLPSVSSTGAPIIGPYRAILDSVDPTIVYTKQPIQVVRRRVATASMWKIPVYYFAYAGNRLEHTGASVIIEAPVFDYGAQVTLYNANGNFPLADDLMEAAICGGMSMLIRDDEFRAQAGDYVAYFTDTLNSFRPAKAA